MARHDRESFDQMLAACGKALLAAARRGNEWSSSHEDLRAAVSAREVTRERRIIRHTYGPGCERQPRP